MKPNPAENIVTDVEVIEAHTSPSNLQPPIATRNHETPVEDIPTKQRLIERLLSPEALQRMMMCGGGVLAIGFAIWLWTIGVFDNPLIAATIMAAGNFGVLAAGLWLVTKTRFKLAGRGLTLLACLLMPLHLWFYEAQGLIEIAAGGPLWIPALVCCLIYAAVARLTRDSMFVYTLVGGVVLTGLLFLAGPRIGLIWAVIPTSLFLVSLGGICIHADRFFVEDQGAFSRNEFGLAFFRVGHFVLAGGLLYLLGGQTINLFFDWLNVHSDSVSLLGPIEQLWSIGILAAAAWSYGYSQATRPAGNVFAAMVAAIAIWIGIVIMDLLAIQLTFNAGLLLIGGGLTAIQFGLQAYTHRSAGKNVADHSQLKHETVLLASSIMLATIGLAQTVFALIQPETFFNWTLVSQLAVTVTSLWAGLNWFGSKSNQNGLCWHTSAIVLALGTVLALSQSLPFDLAWSAIAAFVVPVILASFSQLLPDSGFRKPLQLSSGSATLSILIVALGWMAAGQIVFASWPALMATSIASGLMAYVGSTISQRGSTAPGLMLLAIPLAQLAAIFDLTSPTPIILTISAIGSLVLLIASIKESLTKNAKAFDSTGELIGNVLILSGAAAALLYVVPLTCLGNATGWNAGLLFVQLLPVGIGYVVNRIQAWKSSYSAMAIALAAMTAITFISLSGIHFVYRLEILSLIGGAILLVAGHIGLVREEQNIDDDGMSDQKTVLARSESVTASLIFGSLFLAVPMIIGVVAFRLFGVDSADGWKIFHNVGGLVVGLSLLGTGILCQVRSTTLAGTAVIGSYLVTLLLLLRLPQELQSVSVMMMIGGGAFFGVAILLSFYRDWLLGLPQRVREGRGVFRVMNWR